MASTPAAARPAARSTTGGKQRAPARAAATAPDPAFEFLNLVVVQGRCASPPESRVLDSGRQLASLAVVVRPEGSGATWVPVTVWEPPAWLERLGEGDEILVVGRVRRSFFAVAGGGRSQRVDVEATFVGRPGRRRDRDAARQRLDEALQGLAR